MCGRYYIDESLEEALENDLAASKARLDAAFRKLLRRGDIFPSQNAPALTKNGGTVLQWGFPGYDGKGLLINARGETAASRPAFRDSFDNGRCILPASGFYEWDAQKSKLRFTLPGRRVLYLAGLSSSFGPGPGRFVVLTTAANDSMLPYHDRMPVLLSAQEVDLWLRDRAFASEKLKETMPELRAERLGQMELTDFL